MRQSSVDGFAVLLDRRRLTTTARASCVASVLLILALAGLKATRVSCWLCRSVPLAIATSSQRGLRGSLPFWSAARASTGIRRHAELHPEDQEARWLPPVDTMQGELSPSEDTGTTVLPMFPCSSVAFTPYSEQTLNIFEPRYRKLYNDILFSGSRRFVVSAVNPADGRFAEVGVVFYLNDLRDVSEQSGDQVKYVCEHRVIGRVRIKRVLNPDAWEDESTYLRVETEPVEDSDPNDDCAEEENQVMSLLQQLTGLQKDLDVVQISPDVDLQLNASRAPTGGLWSLVSLWSDYFEYLVEEREQRMQVDMEKTYRRSGVGGPLAPADYEEDGENEDEVDLDDEDAIIDELTRDEVDFDELEELADDLWDEDEIDLDSLPPPLQLEMSRLQDECQEDVECLAVQQSSMIQQLVQTTSHRKRLALFADMLRLEVRKLSAKRSLTTIQDGISSERVSNA